MVKTTVVIPNYNGIDYLKECLRSLYLIRDSHMFDIIVVDNGSEDGSADLVADEYPDVMLIRLDENTGFAAAVNRGIEHTRTEYVLLLNNDIKVRDNFVKALEECMDSDKKLFSVNSVMLSMADPDVLDGAGDYYCALGWAFAYKKGKPAKPVIDRGDRNIFSACGGASIYRIGALKETGLFDEAHFAYLEDTDLGYRARILGYKSRYTASAVCEHAGSGYSGSRYNEFKISLSSRNSIYLIFKNMPFLQFIINLPFLIIGYFIKILFFTLKGFGKTYLKGLGEGFKLAFSEEGRRKHVRFRAANTLNYICIQFELWANMFRRITG